MNSIYDADVVAIRLVRELITNPEASDNIADLVGKAMEDVSPAVLIAVLAGHVATLATMVDPQSPELVFGQFESLTTMVRLDPGDPE